MSSYVDSVLAEGERIVYRASISHWKFFPSYFVGGLILLIVPGAYMATENHAGASLSMLAIATCSFTSSARIRGHVEEQVRAKLKQP